MGSVRRGLSLVLSVALVAGGLSVARDVAGNEAVAEDPPAVVDPLTPPDGMELLALQQDRAVFGTPGESGYVARVFEDPVAFQDAQGAWQPIDTTVVPEGGGLSNGAGPVDVDFAEQADADALVTLTDGDASVSFGLAGASGATATAAGNRVTYDDAIGSADLEYRVSASELKEIVRLEMAPTAAPVFRFPLELSGLTPSVRPSGAIVFEDSDGDEVVRVPIGTMIDSSSDELGEVATADVVPELVGDAQSGWAIEISPDFAWLSDPARVYPVAVDPTYSWFYGGAGLGCNATSTLCDDAVVQSANPTVNYNGSAQQNGSGEYLDTIGKSGSNTSQTFLHFDTTFLSDKTVQSASLYGFAKYGATGASYTVKRATATWDASTITWNTRPSVSSTVYGTANWTANDQWVPIEITSLVAGWADGTFNNRGMRIEGSTTASSSFLADEAGWPFAPFLEVEYNTTPTKPAVFQVNGVARTKINKTQPTLGAQVEDRDGGEVTGQFEIFDNTKTTLLASGDGTKVPAGAFSTWQVSTALTAGVTYQWHARSTDGEMTSAWSVWKPITVDTTAPDLPTITGATWTSNAWSGPSGTGSFTFNSNGSGDVARYWWGFDEGDSPSEWHVLSTNGASYTLNLGGTGEPDVPRLGWHDLVVRSEDVAGNVSSPKHFQFGNGYGTLLDVDSQVETTKKLTVGFDSKSTYDGVALYRNRPDTGWVPVSPAHVTYQSSGSAVSSWPVACDACSSSPRRGYPKLVWDVSQTLGKDGQAEIAAVYYIGNAPQSYVTSAPTTVILDQNGFGIGDNIPAGPGDLNPVTGNLSISATDVSLGGMSVTRTFESRDQNASGSFFGPGWVSNVAAESTGATHLIVQADSVAIYDGTEQVGTFARQADGSFKPQEGMVGVTLTKSSTPDTYALSFYGFSTVTFAPTSGGSSDRYDAVAYDDGTSTSAGDIAWEVSGGVVRPVRQVAPSAAGVSCSSSPTTTAGCRTLTFTYASSTTATGTSESGWGDYAGRLKTVTYWSWYPGKTGGAGMDSVDVATYSYDSNGRLRAAWDPRLTNPLKTKYSYTSDGQIATITPAGEEGVTLTYAPLGSEPSGTGRLATIERPQQPGSSTMAVTTVRYDIPLSGSGAPQNMSGTEVARWAQTDLPVNATAIFPPDQIPTGTPPSSYARATITYVNTDGQIVNTLDPAGAITTSEHNEWGEAVRSLSPANREQALADGATTAEEAALANQLDGHSVLDPDTGLVTDTYGPAHAVVTSAGAVIRARQHVHTVYDENAPGGAGYDLPTTVTESAYNVDTGTTVDAQSTSNVYAYDIDQDGTVEADEDYGWDLGTPLRTIVDPGGLNLITTTLYNPTTGELIERRLPSAPNGGTAAATQFLYYTAGTHPTDSACGNKAKWAGLACKTQPAAQPGTSGLPDLPTKKVTSYNRYDQPTVTVETVGGVDVRTTTQTYDAAGRPKKNDIDSTIGTDIPEQTTNYSTSTGRVTTITADGLTITNAYNTLGQLTSYTDADNNTSTYTYDNLGRPATFNDGKATQTYTYNTNTEPRGLPTQIVDSGVGTFTATYDIEGRLAAQQYPGGLNASSKYNEAGEQYGLIYTKTGGTYPTFLRWFDIHGRSRWQWGTLSGQNLSYDNAGRLTQVQDTVPGTGCATRVYTFDANTNRSSLTARDPQADGSCNTSGGTTTNYSYDAADRTVGGYSYDALGRSTSISASHAPAASTTTVGYYVNDLARTVSAAAGTNTYDLDPTRRYRSWTNGTDVHTNHYTAAGDSPAWSAQSATGAWTRYVSSFTTNAATQTQAGSPELNITNLHGDIVATAGAGANTWSNFNETIEYGAARQGSGSRYDYLGAFQRHRDEGSGLIFMGVRGYNPRAGRFVSGDSVIGGNANPYDYCSASAVDCLDLDGRIGAGWAWGKYGFYFNWGILTGTFYIGPLFTRAIHNWRNEIGEAKSQLTKACSAGAKGTPPPLKAVIYALCGVMWFQITDMLRNAKEAIERRPDGCLILKFQVIMVGPVPSVAPSYWQDRSRDNTYCHRAYEKEDR